MYIEPLDLNVGLVTKLCEVWEPDYPGIKQVPPRPRTNGAGLPGTDPFALSWPMPAVELVNRSLARTIRFQFDQVSLTWRFDAAGDQYPSYDVLADELIAKFADFVRIVDSVSGETVEVQGCQCYYTNSLEEIGGLNWLFGYLTDWSNAGAVGKHAENAGYFGLHIHRDDEEGGIKRNVLVNFAEGDTQVPELDIKVVAVQNDPSVTKSDDPSKAARVLLDSAHRLENETFESSFSDDMKTKWGIEP